LIAVILLVRFKIQNHPKRKLIGPDNRQNQTLLTDISDQNYTFTPSENRGKPKVNRIECLQQENPRKSTKIIKSRKKKSKIFRDQF